MNEVKTPAYFVVQLEIKNQDEYIQRYGMPVLAMFESMALQENSWVENGEQRLR